MHANARMGPVDQTTVDWALAVDYGTIVTCAAVSTGDRVEILEVGFDRCLPSPVGVDDEGRFVTGRDAVELGRWDAERVERAPKRALAAGAAVQLGGRAVDPIDLVAATLRRVADVALRRFGGTPPSRVVLTHPVHWPRAATDRLLVAATRAGLAGLELLPEPLAVAAFHGAAVPVGGHVAVFGLGCDSFGAAVLRRTATAFELCSGAHREFGGEAVDGAMLELVAGHARGADPDAWDRVWTGSGSRGELMRERLVEAKAELSSRPWVAVAVDGIDSGVRITRRELERAVEERLSTSVRELLRDGDVEPAELEAVYLSGGASRMPRIAELIRERTGLTPDVHDDPKAVVALGALERLTACATPELVLAGASSSAAAVSAPTGSTGYAGATAITTALPIQRDADIGTVPAIAPDAGDPADAVVEVPPAGPATGRSPQRLRPVLVGVGMAALVAGVVTPIALNSGSASAPPATLPPPVVVVATTLQAAPTTTVRPTPAPSTAAQATATPVRTARPTSARPTSARPTSKRVEPPLDARHLALLRALPDVGGVRWSTCAAYPSGETAVYVTAIQCSPSDPSLARNVVFYRLADAGAYTEMNRTSAAEVSGTGSCAAGDESTTTWGTGPTPKGFLVCYDDPDTGDFRMAWASSESLLAAVISDPKAATAYTWWKAHNATVPSAGG